MTARRLHAAVLAGDGSASSDPRPSNGCGPTARSTSSHTRRRRPDGAVTAPWSPRSTTGAATLTKSGSLGLHATNACARKTTKVRARYRFLIASMTCAVTRGARPSASRRTLLCVEMPPRRRAGATADHDLVAPQHARAGGAARRRRVTSVASTLLHGAERHAGTSAALGARRTRAAGTRSAPRRRGFWASQAVQAQCL